jgi:hypothetical protein
MMINIYQSIVSIKKNVRYSLVLNNSNTNILFVFFEIKMKWGLDHFIFYNNVRCS